MSNVYSQLLPTDQFNYYIWDNPDDDSGPTKPPNYILLENLLYKNYFISWDLENQTAQCEVVVTQLTVLLE